MLPKLPKLQHLPWSPGIKPGDEIISSLSQFIGTEVVVTEKMDGDIVAISRDSCSADSLSVRLYPAYRIWMLRYWNLMRYSIPEGYSILGEYLRVQHTISYKDLSSYFIAFSVWKDDICLAWKDTTDFLSSLSMQRVRVIYRGKYEEDIIRSLQIDPSTQEGYVMRTSGAFTLHDYNKSAAKYIRKYTEISSWLDKPIVDNKLR